MYCAGRDTPCTPVMEQAFPQNETKKPGAEERFTLKECLRAAYECCDPRAQGEYRQRDPKRAAKAHGDFEQEYNSWNDYIFARYLFLLVLRRPRLKEEEEREEEEQNVQDDTGDHGDDRWNRWEDPRERGGWQHHWEERGDWDSRGWSDGRLSLIHI